MKKLMIVALALFTTSALAAHPGHRGGEGRHLDRMEKQLDLSTEQRQQLEALFAEQREQRQALREQKQASMQTILTAEQQEKMAEMRDNRKQRWQEKRQQRKADQHH